MEHTYLEFLNNSYEFIERIVVAFPDFAKAENLIKKSKWKIEHKFTKYLHKSLSKEIFVLKK